MVVIDRGQSNLHIKLALELQRRIGARVTALESHRIATLGINEQVGILSGPQARGKGAKLRIAALLRSRQEGLAINDILFDRPPIQRTFGDQRPTGHVTIGQHHQQTLRTHLLQDDQSLGRVRLDTHGEKAIDDNVCALRHFV